MNKTRTQQTRGKVYEEFGEKIKQLRVSKNLTQDELSKQIGISRTNIGQYETGVRKVPLNIILEFANFFDVSVDYLLDIEVRNEEASKPQLTKYEVATELGFTKDEISLLESEKKQIPKSFFEKFANYFDVSVDDLVAFKVNQEKTAFITKDKKLSARYERWINEIGYNYDWTDEEIDQIIDFAKYLQSKRK